MPVNPQHRRTFWEQVLRFFDMDALQQCGSIYGWLLPTGPQVQLSPWLVVVTVTCYNYQVIRNVNTDIADASSPWPLSCLCQILCSIPTRLHCLCRLMSHKSPWVAGLLPPIALQRQLLRQQRAKVGCVHSRALSSVRHQLPFTYTV